MADTIRIEGYEFEVTPFVSFLEAVDGVIEHHANNREHADLCCISTRGDVWVVEVFREGEASFYL